MPDLELAVISLRYSSWSMRPWLALHHAGLRFRTRTAGIDLGRQQTSTGTSDQGREPLEELERRRAFGSVTGLFPVLWVDGEPIHESLAICEWAHEAAPLARLWPSDPMARARARAVSCEMAAGFSHMREHLSCHPFARVPSFLPDAATKREIRRVHELWQGCLERSGGPFLFGHPTIADFMYFPVVTRFETYGVPLSIALRDYRDAMWALPAVQAWRTLALTEPRIPIYDAYIEQLDGDASAGESEHVVPRPGATTYP